MTRIHVTPIQALQRTADFTILEAVAVGGVTVHLKVPRHSLHLFHTADVSVLFAWYEGGKLRFGCQRPRSLPGADAFLTKDVSKLPRCSLDSDYKPLPDVFEPWAQIWASSEQTAGYGLVSQLDDLQEPWMEGRFDHDTVNEQSHMTVQGNVPPQYEVLKGGPVLATPSSSHQVLDDFPEPWAYDHVLKDCELRQTMHHDSDDFLPEWFSPHRTIFSTSAGIIHHSGPTHTQVDTGNSQALSPISAALHACQTSLSGLCHWLCSAKDSSMPGSPVSDVAFPNRSFYAPRWAGIAHPSDDRERLSTALSGSCHPVEECTTFSPCQGGDQVCHTILQGPRRGRKDLSLPPCHDAGCASWAQTCLSGLYRLSCHPQSPPSLSSLHSPSGCANDQLSSSKADREHSSPPTYGTSLNHNQQDFVKLYWDRTLNAKFTLSLSSIDMVDVKQFCQKHRIQYTINTRAHFCEIPSREVHGKSVPDSPLTTSRYSSSGYSPDGAGHVGCPCDCSFGCDKRLGCIPSVPIHPEWLNQNHHVGIRDVFIPPQPLFRTKIKRPQSFCSSSDSQRSQDTQPRVNSCKNQLRIDSPPPDTQLTQPASSIIYDSYVSPGDEGDGQLAVGTIPNNFCSTPATSIPLYNSAISWPSDSNHPPTDNDLHVIQNSHQETSQLWTLSDVTMLVQPVLQQFTTSCGAVPTDNIHFQHDFDDIDIRSSSSQQLSLHTKTRAVCNVNGCVHSFTDIHLARSMTWTSSCAVMTVLPVLQHLTICNGAVPVHNLEIQIDPCSFIIGAPDQQAASFDCSLVSAFDNHRPESLRKLSQRLDELDIVYAHSANSQPFSDDCHALRLLFDMGHTNEHFRYLWTARSETEMSVNTSYIALPGPQHSTTSSGAVPVNELNFQFLRFNPQLLYARSRVLAGQFPSDKLPRTAIQLPVLRSDHPLSDQQYPLLHCGAVPRCAFQEFNIDDRFGASVPYLFNCRQTKASLPYSQQHSTVFWPDTQFTTPAALWPYLLSPPLSMSTVELYGNQETLLPVPAPQQTTIFSGAVPDNNIQTSFGCSYGTLIAESTFPTVPNYVNKFKEEVYANLPSRGHSCQLALPWHRNNVVAAPRTLLLQSDFFSSSDLMLSHHTTPVTPSASPPRGALRNEDSHKRPCSTQFRGWSQAIYSGGHPAWGKCQVVHMNPNPPFAERCAAALQDDGWLASDEALWFLRKIQQWRSDIAVGPMIQWSPSRDLRRLMATEDQLQCDNHYLTLLLFLVEAHWCAVEVDRRTSPVHVVIIQWPEEFHSMITLEMSRILQIPSHRMLVTVNSDHETLTMCGWTILHRWYLNFAMQTCLQPLIHVVEQHQDQLDRVTLRAQHCWGRTNATADLCHFATECRQAFLSEYARSCPDTRLPPSVSTTMFVGPTQEYIREACQVPRPPTNREREINWLRTMLIQPAWLTNFELETVLQSIRLQLLDRYIPSPLHFDSKSELLEPFTDDLPTVAGYTKVLFFITYHHHWISISGLKHQNRWMLTAAVPDPHSAQLPLLFAAVATILESSPERIHVQATETQSPLHLCGWVLLKSLHDQVQVPLVHDTTLLLQRIAVMPNSRIKNLLFEEALATWTRHAPNQELITFATQVRTFFLAHMDTWNAHHQLHFGGMFQPNADSSTPASWHTVSPSTKNKIMGKIRAHVQRPICLPVCPASYGLCRD